MSLRVRLALLFVLLFVAGVAAITGQAVTQARQSIAAESRSAAGMVNLLLALNGPGGQGVPGARRGAELLRQLEMADDWLRHMEIGLLSLNDQEMPPLAAPAPINAPGWFIALVAPPAPATLGVLPLNATESIVFRSNPGHAVEAAWKMAASALFKRLLALAGFAVLMYWLVGRWLRPLGAFVRTLEEVERGDFSRRVPKMHLPELSQVAEKMNRLTASLGASSAENERLTRKSLRIQEAERRYLAQELHDAMGQSISAIKAIAVSIAQRCEGGDARAAESARKIEEISDMIYESVRDMMGRLRPSVLYELGLEAALLQMVDHWNEHHDEAFCRLRMECPLDDIQEEQQVHVYRIVQEALTNVAKHSRAQNAAVTFSGLEVISLSIEDDGVGYDPLSTDEGMGLIGIRERVRSLQGQLSINALSPQGTGILIEFPRVTTFRRRRSTDVVLQ